MKGVDFDTEKEPLGQAVPLRSVRAREDWPYGSSREDKINKTCTTISRKTGRDDTDPSVGECSANLLAIDRYPIARFDC